MLDPKKITHKTSEAINAALELARDEQHQQLVPLHIAVVVFEDPRGGCRLSESAGSLGIACACGRHSGKGNWIWACDTLERAQRPFPDRPPDPGLAHSTCLKLGGEEAWKSICRLLRRRLLKQPKIEPAPDEVFMGKDVRELFKQVGKNIRLISAACGLAVPALSWPFAVQATKLQKDKKDAFLSIDVLLSALLSTADVSTCLQEAGLQKGQLENIIQVPRGRRVAKWT